MSPNGGQVKQWTGHIKAEETDIESNVGAGNERITSTYIYIYQTSAVSPQTNTTAVLYHYADRRLGGVNYAAEQHKHTPLKAALAPKRLVVLGFW